MSKALRLARRGEGATAPNPMVGAVIAFDQEEIAKGWHRAPGHAHAEVVALDRAGERSRGATLYVNLEPCAHHGRTPPCTEAIIKSGIARVVAASQDPDLQVSGSGLAALREAGIEVETGRLEDEARALNAPYFMHRTKGRPFVTYKAAASLDGRIAAADGSSTWITSEDSRRDAHKLRSISDAICVGISTVLADDPLLTARGFRKKSTPLRVIADSSGRTPPGARVIGAEALTLVVVTEKAPHERVAALEKAGAEVAVVESHEGRVSVEGLLKLLAGRGILSVLLEGGGTLAGSFAASGLIDKYVFYLAPKLLGATTKGLLEGWAAPTLSEAEVIQLESIGRIGGDLKIVARPTKSDQ